MSLGFSSLSSVWLLTLLLTNSERYIHTSPAVFNSDIQTKVHLNIRIFAAPNFKKAVFVLQSVPPNIIYTLLGDSFLYYTIASYCAIACSGVGSGSAGWKCAAAVWGSDGDGDGCQCGGEGEGGAGRGRLSLSLQRSSGPQVY